MRKGVSLAIDPGYDRVGVAVFDGSELLFSECYTPPNGPFEKRLVAIFNHLNKLVGKYKPRSMALETLYFSKNQKTALKVAEARGVIEVVAAKADIPVIEYSPQAVKIAVTGSGNASKEGVQKMVDRLIVLPSGRRLDDEYDAIALGIAHSASRLP